MIKRHPGSQVIAGVLKIEDFQALANAAHQVAIGHHNALGRAGGTGGVLQVQKILRLMGRYFPGRRLFYLVGVHPLEGHYVKERFFEQRAGHIGFRLPFHSGIGDQKTGLAGFEHRNKAVQLALIDRRGNDGENHPGNHAAPHGIHRTGILHGKDNGPVAGLGPFLAQFSRHIHGVAPRFTNGHPIVPVWFRTAIQKVVQRTFRCAGCVSHVFFQNTVHNGSLQVSVFY